MAKSSRVDCISAIVVSLLLTSGEYKKKQVRTYSVVKP
jgi:hypothetical protein